MPIFRWGQAWSTFQDLEREVDRLLHGVNLSLHGIRLGSQFPALNLYELDDEFLLTAELAGVATEDLDITVADGVLTIAGKRNAPEGVSEDNFRRNERFRGNWQRAINLPERVREEDLTAEFLNGILKIHLPKAEETPARQIPVVEGA